MVLYTSNVPQPNQTVAASQPIINANFNYLQTWAQVDHYSSGDSTDTKNGYHQWVTFSDFTGAPGLGAGRGVLYADRDGSSNPILAYQNSLGSFALTGRNPSVAASGYTCLPGGVYLQWGFVTTSLNGTSGTQTFLLHFPIIVSSLLQLPVLHQELLLVRGLLYLFSTQQPKPPSTGEHFQIHLIIKAFIGRL